MNVSRILPTMVATLAAVLPSCKEAPTKAAPPEQPAVEESAAPEPISLPPDQQAKAEYYYESYSKLRDILQSIEDSASANAAVEQLDKLNDQFAEFLNLPPTERQLYAQYYATTLRAQTEDIYSCYRGEQLRISGLDVLQENEALAYELIIRENPAGYYFQGCEDVIAKFLMEEEETGVAPAVAEFRKEHMAKHQEAHDAFMKGHAADYAGGNGTSEAEAIILRPFTEGKADPDKDLELLAGLINDYLSEVYPDGETAWGFTQATPEGAVYHTRSIIYGLYKGLDFKQHMKTHKLYFQTMTRK